MISTGCSLRKELESAEFCWWLTNIHSAILFLVKLDGRFEFDSIKQWLVIFVRCYRITCSNVLRWDSKMDISTNYQYVCSAQARVNRIVVDTVYKS